MSEYKYILEPYRSMKDRYKCPGCGKPGKFARYIDTETTEQLGDSVGKCERSDNCAYHYTPKQYFADNGIVPEHNTDVAIPKKRDPEKPTTFIDAAVFNKSLSGFDKNNFIKYLNGLFDSRSVTEVINTYKVGTSKHWPGSTIFWQVDQKGKVRAGKIMQYDSVTGKRVKEPKELIQWAHILLKLKSNPNFNLKQCFFGQHLLVNNTKPVAVVESEKTAIIASVYLPQFLWIASGNKQGLNHDKCIQLKNQKVILYPDLNAFKDWKQKAKEYGFGISDLLEKKATEQEREKGLDLADYLIQFNIKDFLSSVPYPQPVSEDLEPTTTIGKSLTKLNIQEQNLTKPDIEPITAELFDLRKYYQDLEDNGLIPDQHRSYIGTLWQGVVIYQNKPTSLKLYTDPLNQIRTEIETLYNQKLAI